MAIHSEAGHVLNIGDKVKMNIAVIEKEDMDGIELTTNGRNYWRYMKEHPDEVYTVTGFDFSGDETGYELDGVVHTDFMSCEKLLRSKPVYEYVPGFDGNISGCRRFSDLPKAAQDYVKLMEDAVHCRISYVSVGADRDEYIQM